jgi:FkbM family methyltransferase
MFRVRGQSDDLYHVLPGQEPAVEAAIRSRLRPGDTFIDAGANIGFYTVLAERLVGPDGHVVAFEMIPTTADILRDHVAINGCKNVTIHEGALASTTGRLVEASVRPGKYGSASIARRSGKEVIAVRTITLADALQEVLRVRLVKMDLEGAEFDALQGLGAALTKVEAIIFEDKGGPETMDFLIAHGFRCRRIDGANALAERDATLIG